MSCCYLVQRLVGDEVGSYCTLVDRVCSEEFCPKQECEEYEEETDSEEVS